MKSALVLALVFLSSSAIASHGIVHQHRSTGLTGHNTRGNDGWCQASSGTASFTAYTGCDYPSCGITTSGYTAAVNTCAFGAYSGAGGACGRCFKITSTQDPYTPSFEGPFNSIVVRVSDLCPHSTSGTPPWCDQTVSNPVNQYGMSMHFDLCKDPSSGAAGAFFPPNRWAMLGTFAEVPCEGNWEGTLGDSLWGNSCMASGNTNFWPNADECSNNGSPPP
ncbi:RlpA-like double-psi beta-barrel-protein domain-containing protein-containing protein [Russula aff. rugulosa BPL654]|nr:RlpA-like double-psi beta-barrel-protein domain-containing protein-containing protein [Russula aff. rugulosa BPL654]